jgi:hypothetical protein
MPLLNHNSTLNSAMIRVEPGASVREDDHQRQKAQCQQKGLQP